MTVWQLIMSPNYWTYHYIICGPLRYMYGYYFDACGAYL